MKIYKYYPAFFEGFPNVECEVNSKEELLNCEICKPWVKDGFVIATTNADYENSLYIMAVKYEPKNLEGYIYYVISQNVSKSEDRKQLKDWLPDYKEVCEQLHKRKLEETNK